MKYLVVTSWSEEGGRLYGETWLESFKKHWPANAAALVVTDALIYSDPVAKDFFDRHADKRMDTSAKGYNYRMDLYRFAHKIFALKLGNEKATEIGAEWVVWLDGDVVTKQKISEETLADWLPDDKEFVYLSRRETWDHPECGFMGFKTGGKGTLEAVVSEWITDKVLKYAERHDSHIIGELAKTWPEEWKFDLCPRSEGLDAFTPSPLGPYLDHRKGNRKREYTTKVGDKAEVDKITGGAFGGNVILKTRNCRPEEEIRENIRANLQKITQWIRPCQAHRTPQILVSAGASVTMPETLEALREWRARGASIWCVKHSHNALIENGIVPWACVLLDPRPHEGPSTHGFDRAEMLASPHPDVRYLVASMVDPSVVVGLLARGANVWGWHAAVGANEKEIIPKDHHLTPGGSTSVMRAISLGWMMGYRSVEAYAMDSCHFDMSKLDMTKKNPDGTDKYFTITVEAGGVKQNFVTDRDLLAQAQDFTRLVKEQPLLNINAHGPGMVPFILRATRGNSKGFEEVYGFPPA